MKCKFILNFAKCCPLALQKVVVIYAPVHNTGRCLFPHVIFEKFRLASRTYCNGENMGILSEKLGASWSQEAVN